MNIILKNDQITAEFSTRGAELRSLVKDGREYLWQGDPAIWGKRAPLLFPYVGRFYDGKYRLKGKEYPMTIHGFASVSEFAAEEQTDEEVCFLLTDSPESLEIYPFRFELRVTYRLLGSRLCVRYEVLNLSDEMMYFAIGGHPGFQVPLEDGLSFEDYFLDFGTAHDPWRVGHTESVLLSGQDTAYPLQEGRYLPLRHDLFDDDAVVLKHMARSVTLKTDKGERSVTVDFPDMPYLGIWHKPKTEAPYVCIEPWTSLPSRQDVVEDLAIKGDLIHLKAGDLYENEWFITIS